MKALTLKKAIDQRDRAESRARSVELQNKALQDRIARMKEIAHAAGLVLSRWECACRRSGDVMLDLAISELSKAVMS